MERTVEMNQQLYEIDSNVYLSIKVKLPQFFIVYSYGAHGTKHHTGCSINNGKNPLVLKGGKEKN